ncbi:hypothetical protein [Haloarchaeobius sp. TZWWS8]|uniref:hypothetical protein n=1 Tax=Haloarchaeobius sp. TZWWS8 TaxID=3446121 RepID=UPI003EBC6347
MANGLASVVFQSATDPVHNIEQIIEGFTSVAANGDPLSIALLAIGGLLLAFSGGVFGLLTLGGLGSALTRGFTRSPPRTMDSNESH